MEHFGAPEIVLIVLAIVVMSFLFTVLPFWMIFKKAGYHPALSLLMLVPFVDIAMRFYLAFAEWPSLKQVQK